MRALCAMLLGAVLVLSGGAYAGPGKCRGWDAIYSADLNDQGDRARVEFAEADSSAPEPFHLSGHSASGERLWRHTGHYWCYQGAGGCYVGLGHKEKKVTEDEGTNRYRIVFVDTKDSERAEDEAPPILVLAGLNSAFFYGQNFESLVIDRFTANRDPVFVPEVYHFEACR